MNGWAGRRGRWQRAGWLAACCALLWLIPAFGQVAESQPRLLSQAWLESAAVEHPRAELERAAFVRRHLDGRLRGLKPVGLRSEACLYTLAPRSDFVIRPHEANPDVVVVSACSGHGFKHSAAVGESIAQSLLGARPHCDLSSFG